MTTSQSFLITGVIDGAPIGTFDTYSGGGAEADIAKHRPGGMVGENTYGALPTYGDVTIGRELDLTRDLELHRKLIGRVGRALGSLSIQPLDENGSPSGKPFTRTGRLSGCTDPESDSNSSEVTMYELTMVISGAA